MTARNDLKTQKDLDRFVSTLYTETWDPNLPVWRAFVINDLEDGRHVASTLLLLLPLRLFLQAATRELLGLPCRSTSQGEPSAFRDDNFVLWTLVEVKLFLRVSRCSHRRTFCILSLLSARICRCRSLLLLKIDHAIADGVGLLDVLFNIIDNTGGDSPKKLFGGD